MSQIPLLLQVDAVKKTYWLPKSHPFQPEPAVHALGGVSLSVRSGESLGIVGESGSGKSTLARIIMALDAPTSGAVCFNGQNLHQLKPAQLRLARRGFQMVFQDPFGSLDPRMTVLRIVGEPLRALALDKAQTPEKVRQTCAETLASVGLREADLDKYPHEFSGGQRQRIAIARALVTKPQLIVADEPVSALDVSVQAQVLNLLQSLQTEFGITLVLISHDLAVVRHLCEHVAVMQGGLVLEHAHVDALFGAPQHAYTRELLSAAA